MESGVEGGRAVVLGACGCADCLVGDRSCFERCFLTVRCTILMVMIIREPCARLVTKETDGGFISIRGGVCESMVKVIKTSAAETRIERTASYWSVSGK